MEVVALIAKSGLALMLVMAGAAKLADLSGFAMTARLFIPRMTPSVVVQGIAAGIGVGELVLGTASFSFPHVQPINYVVLGMGCLFVAVAVVGWIFHQGVQCRCFGRLSRRTFDLTAVARSVLIAGLAAVAVTVAAASTDIQISPTSQIVLVAAAVLLACGSYAAARAVALTGGVDAL